MRAACELEIYERTEPFVAFEFVRVRVRVRVRGWLILEQLNSMRERIRRGECL